MYVFALMCGTAVNAVSMAHLSAKRGRTHIHIHKFSYVHMCVSVYLYSCVVVLKCAPVWFPTQLSINNKVFQVIWQRQKYYVYAQCDSSSQHANFTHIQSMCVYLVVKGVAKLSLNVKLKAAYTSENFNCELR